MKKSIWAGIYKAFKMGLLSYAFLLCSFSGITSVTVTHAASSLCILLCTSTPKASITLNTASMPTPAQAVRPNPTGAVLPVSTITVGSSQSNSSNIITRGGVPIPFWQLVIMIVALLAVLLLMNTFLRARCQRTLKVDLEKANRRVRIDAPQVAEMDRAKAEMEHAKRVQQIAEMEAAQRAQAQQSLYGQPMQQSSILVPAQSALAQLPCPRCGELVLRDAKYCSKCRLMLSPSESGMHLRPQVVSRPVVSNWPLTDQPMMPTLPLAPAASTPEQAKPIDLKTPPDKNDMW